MLNVRWKQTKKSFGGEGFPHEVNNQEGENMDVVINRLFGLSVVRSPCTGRATSASRPALTSSTSSPYEKESLYTIYKNCYRTAIHVEQ
jgi:hypothetical protein